MSFDIPILDQTFSGIGTSVTQFSQHPEAAVNNFVQNLIAGISEAMPKLEVANHEGMHFASQSLPGGPAGGPVVGRG